MRIWGRRAKSALTPTNRDVVLGRYEIHQPFWLDGQLAQDRRVGPPWFFIWDRERNAWVDGAFKTRAAAERRLDELTNSVGVASHRAMLALEPPSDDLEVHDE
jgi:hypothetical protein